MTPKPLDRVALRAATLRAAAPSTVSISAMSDPLPRLAPASHDAFAATTAVARIAANVAHDIRLGKAVADMTAEEARDAAKAAHGAILAFIGFGISLENPALKPLTELQDEAWKRRAAATLGGGA